MVKFKLTCILIPVVILAFAAGVFAVDKAISTNIKPNDETNHQDSYVPLVNDQNEPEDVDQPTEEELQKLNGIVSHPTWQSLSAIRPEKAPYDGPEQMPGEGKVGGETIATATVIGSLPYVDFDYTCDFLDDYDEACSWTSTSPDAVYSFTPAADDTIDISLCFDGTDYDTKLFVYENAETPGAPYACNDDACPGYVSEILGLPVTGGNTYYIVVDGYGGGCGNYELHVDYYEACVVECPAGATNEGEACIPDDGDDVTNGGCNNDVPIFSSISCGETVCGTCNTYLYGTDNYRDTDWYMLTLSETSEVTITGQAEFPVLMGFAEYSAGSEGSGDCADITGYILSGYINVGACEEASASFILGEGDWMLIVLPSVFEGIGCDAQYYLTVECGEVIGRCCYGDPLAPDCDDVNETDCLALGGTWDPNKNCTDNPCPIVSAGDNCSDPLVVPDIPANLPYTNNNYTCGRNNDYPSSAMCYTLYGGGEDMVYELTVTEDTYLQITVDPLGTTYTYFQLTAECPPVGSTCLFYYRNSASTAYSSDCKFVPAGTYYLLFDTWPSPDCIPEFNVTIETCTPPTGRCCYGDPAAPDCDDIYEVDCLALGGMWDELLTCATDPCPIATEGDNCAAPVMVKLPDDLVYTDVNYTCDRQNFYDATCLGYYDGGEDIIYALDVDGDITVDITLDPMGTTYAGMAIATECPPGATCMDFVTNGYSSAPMKLEAVELTTGMYYVMIDTWPSPDCIPEFTLTIEEWQECVVTCPSGATDEGEDCIEDEGDDVTNGGCNNDPPIFSSLACGETICGSCNTYVFGGSNYRDTDWYEMVLTEATRVTLDFESEFPAVFGFLEYYAGYEGSGSCDDLSGYIAPYLAVNPCTPGQLTLDMTAGTWFVFVGPSVYDGIECNGTNEYVLTATCEEILGPVLTYSPTEFLFEALPGESGSGILTIGNTGDLPLNFDLEISYTKEIDGASIYTNDAYQPGTSSTMTFFLQNASSDAEWLDACTVTFPAGVTVDAAAANFVVAASPTHYLASNGETGAGPVTLTWFDDNGGYGNIYSTELAEAAIDLTFDASLSGNITFDWTISGDIYGSPPHDVSGSSEIIVYDPGSMWLSIDIEEGLINPGDPNVEVTVAYDATGLDFGVYEASITLIHNGKADAIIPVTLTVGGAGDATIMVDPDPLLAADNYAIEAEGFVYLGGDFEEGYDVNDVVQSSVMVNTTIEPTAMEILPGFEGFTGEVLKITVPLNELAATYGWLFDVTTQTYSVSGEFGDAATFVEEGELTYIGHVLGDVNNDAALNLLDVLYLVDYVYNEGPDPVGSILAGDADWNTKVNLLDILFLITHIYQEGPAPHAVY
ncbi:MAG: hypothetical protein JW763_04875 [candidate division Zixibacteria bacterium]|nr:hypothetical protein [candidate division Zixibacteria bacterium]